ncbi:MAG: agmatine deiminase family protein [Bacteroidales bacterium]|nr:agmatine deiminase family protein [Bacteroidales bacterium]
MKRFFSIFALMALMAITVAQAQNRKPDWARWHYLSEEEMYTPVRNENFVETDPPTGEPRFVGEFEPMQGVMIRYPLGIPTSLVVDLSNNCHVYCVVSSSYQSSAQNNFQNAGVNMGNVTFVNAPSDSYWIRDYGPWYIFEDRSPAIVDNKYNRNRPNDDNMSQVFANFWSIPMYGMNLTHTGGNMMEDGRGHGVSDELVLNENSNNETNVRNKMRDYLGIDPYHITIDPQGDYIAHVDCWGKYLAPDKILIAQLPQSNPQYALYEQVANYFATTNCCWGYPYRVYRVPEPGGYTLAPYTNSLILNKSVYVPMGDIASYNQGAIDVYQEAMPGYNIVPVYNTDWSISWENTDALHCRTRGVMDFNMLFVDHREVLHGEQEWQNQYPVVSKFIAYSGEPLKSDSLLVYYSINGGAYQVTHMTATGNPDEYVGYITGFEGGSSIDYYVFGADESGHRYTQPVFAELDPHHFTVGEQPLTDIGLYYEASHALELTVNTPEADVILYNGNHSSHTPITITEVFELTSVAHPDIQYLDLSYPELPYTLQEGEEFVIHLSLDSNFAKGQEQTAVGVVSDNNDVVFDVFIDGELLGVTDLSAETKLYPNPTEGIFTVEGANVAKVEVYNLVGQKVYVEQNRKVTIDACEWNKGIYLVNITDLNGAVETKKLVVK